MKYVGDTIVYPKQQDDGSGYRIPIPQYHRAAVGIFPGTKLFLLPIPKTRDLIVTPISPKKWGDLWKLETTLKDTPGAARSIVETLVRNNVNILIQEGLSDYAYAGGLAHEVVLILDLADYYSDIDGNTQHRNTVEKPSHRPNHLVSTLLSNAMDYLHTTPAEDEWDFQFNRMEFFYRNKQHGSKTDEAHLLTDKRAIMVPDRLVEYDIFAGTAPDSVACHIISDTEEKYIKIRFLNPSSKYLLLQIKHAERIGAILSFMNELKTKEANIVNSYNRLASMSRVAVWYAFMELPTDFSANDIDELVVDLSKLDAVESFTVLGDYGFNFDVPALIEGLDLERYEPRTKSKKKRTEKRQETPSTELRVAERRLGLRPFYVGKEWTAEPSSVFIAMPFDPQYEEFYQHHIKDTIEGCGLRAVRTDQEDFPDPTVPLIDVIKEKIATCEFLVADVTGYNANVVYEVGHAHAIGKRVLFICEEKYKEEKGLLFDLSGYLHVFYSPYKPKSFLNEFRKRIEAMAEYDGA